MSSHLLVLFLLLPYLKSFLLSLISLCLQVLLDHFGYDVAFSHDWHSPTWYDARKFDERFGTLRSNRRAKEIMPLLHVVSSDDEDRTDRDPNGDGQGGGRQSSPSGQEGGNVNQADNSGPSQNDQNNSTSNGGQGGNIDANIKTMVLLEQLDLY